MCAGLHSKRVLYIGIYLKFNCHVYLWCAQRNSSMVVQCIFCWTWGQIASPELEACCTWTSVLSLFMYARVWKILMAFGIASNQVILLSRVKKCIFRKILPISCKWVGRGYNLTLGQVTGYPAFVTSKAMACSSFTREHLNHWCCLSIDCLF